MREEMERRMTVLTTLEEIARQINVKLDVDQILELILNRALQMTSAEAGAIDLLDREQNTLSMLMGRGFPAEVCHARPWPLDRGVIGRVVRTGQPSLVADVSQDPDYVAVLPQTRSLLAVPLMARGEVIGVIILESPQVATFSEEDLQFLVGLAGHTAIALENARLYQGAERQLARLSVLADVSRAVSSALDLQEVMKRAVERTGQSMAARIATIRLIEGDHLNVGAAVGYRDPAAREHPIRIDQRLAQIIEGCQPLVLPDLEADPDLPLARRERMQREGVRAYLGVPMIAKDRTIGILSIYREEPHQWTPGEVELASTIANQVAIAVENARLYQEAQRELAERKRVEEALRESEARYRSLFERVPMGLYRTTPVGQILDANLALMEMLGYPDRESLLAINTANWYVNPEDRQQWRTLMEREGVMRDFEVQWRRHDGKIIWVRESARIVQDADGRALYYDSAVEDITERKRTEENIRTYQEQLRSLASQLSLVEEQERRRIATELHDRIGQTLAICKIRLGLLRESASSTDLAGSLDKISELIAQTIQDTRALTFELSSPILYELGLEAAVEWLTEHIQEQHGILSDFEDDRQPKPLEDDIRVLLFKVVRELLINVVKHAQARHVKVSMIRDDGNIQITVTDDGAGFDTSKIYRWNMAEGFGLFSIRERLEHLGGYLEIVSQPGHGTRVTLVAPLKCGETTTSCTP
jgi:PAS domain S-box-containing protein